MKKFILLSVLLLVPFVVAAQVVLPSNLQGPCTGEMLANMMDAQLCANKAQAQGILQGYNITCSVVALPLPAPDPNTGNFTNYSPECTINGTAGFGAYLLAGFQASPGSTAVIQQVNPGWGTLATELRTISAGGTTTVSPPAGTTAGNPPSTPRATPQRPPQPSTTDAYVSGLINIVRSLTEKYRVVYDDTQTTTSNVSDARLQQIISQANTLSYGALTDNERTALTNYLTINRTALIDRNFQTFAPGSVFAWALSMGTGTIPNAEAISLGFTVFDSVAGVFIKTTTTGILTGNPVFTSNVSGIMKVGDSWNITVTGLMSNETIYATGGRKINGVAPSDKTPYTANNLGVLILNGVHTVDVVGDWQLVWTRTNRATLSTLVFSVQNNDPLLTTFCSATNDNSQACADKAQAQARARGYNAICTVSSFGALCVINGSPGHSAALLVGSGDGSNAGWNTLRTELIKDGFSVPPLTGGITSANNLSVSQRTPPQAPQDNTSICQTQYDAAVQAAQGRVCTQNISLMSCGSNPSFTRNATNGCIISELQQRGWTTGLLSEQGATDFPIAITVSAEALNARSSPNRNAAILDVFFKGSTFIATNVVDGEKIEGVDKWWVDQKGRYIWSGGTVQRP